jgi:two-component system sensor histidine kinase GlrK
MPLGVLIYQATDSMISLSRLGREHAQQILAFTNHSQQLQILAEDLVRSAKQYAIVEKPEIKERFEIQLNNYREHLSIQSFFITSDRTPSLDDELTEMINLSLDKQTAQRLVTLVPQTRAKAQQNQKILEKRQEEINLQAQRSQNRLWLQAGILITLSAALILFFSLWITRPVKMLIIRIRDLGHGTQGSERRLEGPQEFVELDRQLDWLEKHLQALEEEKLAFLRHMSHELKTPLTTLREGADLLAEELAGPISAAQRDIIQLMQQSGRSLQTLIEQLLEYNQIKHGTILKLCEHPLVPLLQQALQHHRLQLEQKGIAVSLPEEQMHWLVDKDYLMRALSNLVSNAAVYGEDNGHLDITMERSDRSLHIDICNTGPIIPDEDVDHLFEPFYQGGNLRSGPIKGSGIGLSIARDAVRSLGGELMLYLNSAGRVGFRIILT